MPTRAGPLLSRVRARITDDRPLVTALGLLWAPVVIGLLLVLVIEDIDPVILMRDPAAATDSPRYLGLHTNLGIVGWTVSAVIFLGTAYLLRIEGTSPGFRMCLSAGAFVTILMLDDLLQLHELAGRWGIPQALVFGIYLMAVVTWLVAFREEVAKSPLAILGMGVAMFGISIGIDILFEGNDDRWRLVVEDGAKLLGILALSVYAAGTANRFVVESRRVT